MCLTFCGARARAALSFADVAAEATVFTMTLQSFIIGEIEHDENDCTLSSSATASLDFAVTGSGALPATIQTDVQTAIDDPSSNGFALTLAAARSSDAFLAAARLARSHGQAAVYELTGTPVTGKWALAVRPVFPSLVGLAAEDAPLVVTQPPRSMPTDPSEAGCFWDGETAVLGS